LQPAEAIARPTKIEWVKNPLVILSGSTKEIGRKEKYENKEAGIVQFQYGAACEFVQALTLKAKVKTNMAGLITYQVCTDKMCLPPKTVEFKVGLNQ